MGKSNPFSNQISIPSLCDISYEYFYEHHLKKNLPCLIRNVGTDWISSKLWCKNGKPCFEYLKTKYGESAITVYHCSEKFFDSHKTSTMKFRDYINYWKEYSTSENKTNMQLLYLKDWHLKNESLDDNFYHVPIFFSSDWLNEYLVANRKDDYRFVYMGPAESWTPLHKDVMNTFSWSVNICGYKKWILFPPGQETRLMDEFGRLPHSIERIPEGIKYFNVMQSPGEALFVPSEWYHQVWNLEDTISINHNWVNAANIDRMKLSISQALLEVKKELEHLSDEAVYEKECQDILKCHVGMNGSDFFEFISFIARRRLADYEIINGDDSRKDMIKSELKTIREVLIESCSIGLDRDEDIEKLKKEIEHVYSC